MARKVRVLQKELQFGDYILILILYNKESQAVEILQNQYNIHLDEVGHCEGFVAIDMNYIVVALKNNFTIPTLVHELLHATFKMLDRCSISLTESTEETFAMQIDSLFRIVIKMLKEDKYKLPEL